MFRDIIKTVLERKNHIKSILILGVAGSFCGCINKSNNDGNKPFNETSVNNNGDTTIIPEGEIRNNTTSQNEAALNQKIKECEKKIEFLKETQARVENEKKELKTKLENVQKEKEELIQAITNTESTEEVKNGPLAIL